MSAFETVSRTVATIVLGLALIAAPVGAAAQTAQDHRGNRIEPFRQFGIIADGRRNRTRACTGDRAWCAELIRGSGEERLTLVISPAEGLFSDSRTWVYVLPPNLIEEGGGVSLWDNIVIEGGGAVMVGLDLSKETRRPGFRSYQRRLLLLRAGPGAGDLATPVLEVPLSGHVQQAACSRPEAHPGFPGVCDNLFDLDALFTLVPLLAPDRPALVMVVRASTSPGRRLRSDGDRAPVERTEGDQSPDPGCTYTRSFFFSEALGRYAPDAPLPPCADFLEP